MGAIGDAFRFAFGMTWEVLWALILGFALSGAVQAVVSKQQMRRLHDDHGFVRAAGRVRSAESPGWNLPTMSFRLPMGPCPDNQLNEVQS